MSTIPTAASFTPTTTLMEGPPRPPPLADAILSSLGRPRWGYRGQPWSAFLTYLVALIPPGAIPLVVWHRRFRNLMIVEQQQYWHLADFLRVRGKRPDAQKLRDQTSDLSPRQWISLTMRVITALGVAAFLLLVVTQFRSFSLSTFAEASFGIATSKQEFDQDLSGTGVSVDQLQSMVGLSLPISDVDPAPYDHFWKFCALLLLVGYSVHWYEIRRHADGVRKFASGFNLLTMPDGLPPVMIVPVGIGYQTGWMSAAVISVLLQHEFLWMVPMALAGVIHSRYVLVTCRQARSEFSRRVQMMVAKDHPELNVAVSEQLCINEKCRTPLANNATFCHRCGARQT